MLWVLSSFINRSITSMQSSIDQNSPNLKPRPTIDAMCALSLCRSIAIIARYCKEKSKKKSMPSRN
jgi:hypothetical protein